MSMKRSGRILAALAVVAALAACGDDSTTPATTAPATTVPATTVPVPAAAELRIVSLSPTHTEILFAIGAGDAVVAVDEYSNFPPEASVVASSLSGFEPNVEAIAEYEPDLVVIGGDFTGLTEQLASIDIAVWSGEAPATLDGVYAQIIELGERVGRTEAARQVADDMRRRIDAAVASAANTSESLTYYHELDDTYYSVSATSFIGSVYALFGLTNITELGGVVGDYPQLSAEFIVESNPDIIFLACTVYCSTTAESVAARPGWESVSAVTNARIIALNDDVVSRWGPRVADFVELIASALDTAGASAG
jgi:iron complex transport system substrate-binding protein